MSEVTDWNRSYCDSHTGTSRFIHPNTSIISEWISLTRLMFQHIDSLWKTRLRNARKRFNGAETFLRCLFSFGIKGNALRKSFHKIRSYSLLSSDTQNPNVSSATIFDGVICSCLSEIRFAACVIYLFRSYNPGVFGNTAYQSSLPAICLSSRQIALRRVTSNTDSGTYIASDSCRLHR